MAKSKKDVDFSDLSEADRVRLVTNTALIAQESGGLVVANATRKGTPGVIIWIPNYQIHDGQMNKVANLVANPEKAVVANRNGEGVTSEQ